jgi:hypothetical protein
MAKIGTTLSRGRILFFPRRRQYYYLHLQHKKRPNIAFHTRTEQQGLKFPYFYIYCIKLSNWFLGPLRICKTQVHYNGWSHEIDVKDYREERMDDGCGGWADLNGRSHEIDVIDYLEERMDDGCDGWADHDNLLHGGEAARIHVRRQNRSWKKKLCSLTDKKFSFAYKIKCWHKDLQHVTAIGSSIIFHQ